ncbi:MAG: CoA-binding protein [Mycobacterium sp.]
MRDTTTIAVVGASANPDRAGYEVYSYLVGTGDYRVYPVNPTITEIDGAPTYPSLADLPEPVDLVDVFRRSSELPAVLADVLAMPVRPRTLWLQLGLSDQDVAQRAEAAGITVVMDRCLKVDHQRYR